ncbi:MAG TPA: TetR family transcriptional regulator [Polyangiaceae bacterium]|jgi:AcrR family transcriptional regulator
MSPAAKKKSLRADAERNRQKVLEVAQATFAAEGLAVPIDEIARRAGLGVGTLYRHFPTKEALFQAIVLGKMASMAEEARAQAGAKDPGAAFFGFLAHIVEGSSVKKDLMEALSGAGDEFGRAMMRAKGELRVALGALLARAQAAGVVRRDVEAGEVLALVTATYTAMGRLPPGHGEARARIFAIVCDGLRVR